MLKAAVTHHPLAPLLHDEAHRLVAPRRLYCIMCIVVLDAQKIDQSWSTDAHIEGKNVDIG
jgi:hypothetical protein